MRLERKGRTVVFDPAAEPDPSEIVVLTGPTPARVRATVAALKAGKALTVVTTDALFDYLSRQGKVEGGAPPREVDGLRFDGTTYTAPSIARPREHFLKASVAATRPGAAIRRLAELSRLPSCDPWVVEISFPDGARLLHLDLSLHRGTDDAWASRAASRFGNAEWTIAGVPHGEGPSLIEWLPRFGPNRVLVAELVNAERRELGLPTELVTPWRDRLVGMGVEAHVFATHTGFRFE